MPTIENSGPTDAKDDLLERLLKMETFLAAHDDGICRMEAESVYFAIERITTLTAQVEALRDALRFYQNGFEPYKEHKHLPGFAWRPKELLLDDCGETARAALALKMDQPK